VTAAPGWRGGERLTLTAEFGVVVARRDPGGMLALNARLYVTIPAVLRRRCGLGVYDRVLLAAWPEEEALAAYPLAVIDQALRAHEPVLSEEQPMTPVESPPRSRPGTAPGGPGRPAGAATDGPVGRRPHGCPCRPAVLTFADYVPMLSAAVTARTRRAYGSDWNRIVTQWGDRRLDEPTPSRSAS
jgi:hypothetical protein